MEVICKVDQVKPQASLYWRKGLGTTLTETTPVATVSDGVFQLVSTFTVSFRKTDHDIKLYCLVTRPGDSGTVWATVNKTVKVSCEYIINICLIVSCILLLDVSEQVSLLLKDFAMSSGSN